VSRTKSQLHYCFLPHATATQLPLEQILSNADGTVKCWTTNTAQAEVLFGWMTFSVPAQRRLLLTVNTAAGASTTVGMVKTSQFHAPTLNRLPIKVGNF